MKNVTKLMINEYHIKRLGHDFMGYKFMGTKDLSFHHLLVPKRDSFEKLGCSGYIRENGAILVQDTAHNYLHIIERVDRDMFLAITEQMVFENRKGCLDLENLRKIHDILERFEYEHDRDRTKKGKLLIRPEYILSRKNFKK